MLILKKGFFQVAWLVQSVEGTTLNLGAGV